MGMGEEAGIVPGVGSRIGIRGGTGSGIRTGNGFGGLKPDQEWDWEWGRGAVLGVHVSPPSLPPSTHRGL